MKTRTLRTSKLSRRAAVFALAVLVGAGVGGAVVVVRFAVEAADSPLELALCSIALLLFLGGFVTSVVHLARLGGSRRPVLSGDVATLERAALTDSLTGLRNHRAFHEDLKREIALRNRSGTPFSVLMIDLNRLKQVNDTLGHQAGDERIGAVADAIRSTLRGEDCGYRVGGDEFMIVLPAQRAWGALSVANRLHGTMATRSDSSVTVGIAESTVTESKDTVLKRADLALYEAKRCNLGTVVFSPELDPQRDDAVSPEEATHAQELIATVLARAVDAKDVGTRSHCETVSALSVMIGERLGLAPDRLRRLRIAGLLHDVGKIGIADSILQKPGPLTRDEWRIMRTHSSVGHSIVSATELDEEAGWVLHHHERYDGTGYPSGVPGDEIPLESRIIFVADAFEAMTADRPYRPGRSPAEALDELAAYAGTQFDPLCVAALRAIFEHEPAVPLGVELDPRDEVATRRSVRARRSELSRDGQFENGLKSPRTSADR
jgi:diguanylate cyclase (GGDEF)-like protein